MYSPYWRTFELIPTFIICVFVYFVCMFVCDGLEGWNSGVGGRFKREGVHTYRWFTSLYSTNKHNIVKQLCSTKNCLHMNLHLMVHFWGSWFDIPTVEKAQDIEAEKSRLAHSLSTEQSIGIETSKCLNLQHIHSW